MKTKRAKTPFFNDVVDFFHVKYDKALFVTCLTFECAFPTSEIPICEILNS